MAGKKTVRLKVYGRVRGRLAAMADSTGLNYKTLYDHYGRDKSSLWDDRYYVTHDAEDPKVILKYHKIPARMKVYFELES